MGAGPDATLAVEAIGSKFGELGRWVVVLRRETFAVFRAGADRVDRLGAAALVTPMLACLDLAFIVLLALAARTVRFGVAAVRLFGLRAVVGTVVGLRRVVAFAVDADPLFGFSNGSLPSFAFTAASFFTSARCFFSSFLRNRRSFFDVVFMTTIPA